VPTCANSRQSRAVRPGEGAIGIGCVVVGGSSRPRGSNERNSRPKRLAALAVGPAVIGPLDQLFVEEHVTMTVGACIQKCDRAQSRVTCAELEKMASEANNPTVQLINQCQYFDSLACAVMAWNDQTTTYPPDSAAAAQGRPSIVQKRS